MRTVSISPTTRIRVAFRLIVCSGLLISVSGFAQGSLAPSGAPAPTMKTLDQLDAKIERRTPITNLPFTVTAPGSYFLATNLSSGGNGIVISADSVTLDLNGFELAGGPGSSVGVSVNFVRTNICVRNGTVRGWNGDGLNLFAADSVIVDDLRASRNSGNGLVVGNGAVVSRCVFTFNSIQGLFTGDAANVHACAAYGNRNGGIVGGNGCLLRDVVSDSNTNSGINLSVGASVVDCTSSRNTGTGITTGSGGVVSGCAALDNGAGGIIVGDGSTVRDCRSSGNRSIFGDGIRGGIRCVVKDCATISNSVNGISILGDSVVTGCHSSFNGRAVNAAGIYTPGSGCRIENNQVRDNVGYGIQWSGGDLILRNSAGNNSTNYFPSSGVNFAPVQSPSTATNAWGNFVF